MSPEKESRREWMEADINLNEVLNEKVVHLFSYKLTGDGPTHPSRYVVAGSTIEAIKGVENWSDERVESIHLVQKDVEIYINE